MEPSSDIVHSQNATDQAQTIEPEVPQAGIVSRLAAIIGALIIGVIYYILPEKLKIGPSWLLLLIEVIIFLPILLARSIRRVLPHHLVRWLTLSALGFVVAALAVSVFMLVLKLPQERQSEARTLLYSAILIWFFNMLTFALFYWEIDGGGPVMRHHNRHRAGDFQFPQQAADHGGRWAPHFLDYLFLSFTTATALSPTDTMPLTRAAKTLMMIEALIAMTVIVILASRAVNIL
jgi:uncharacterized membrane protein